MNCSESKGVVQNTREAKQIIFIDLVGRIIINETLFSFLMLDKRCMTSVTKVCGMPSSFSLTE